MPQRVSILASPGGPTDPVLHWTGCVGFHPRVSGLLGSEGGGGNTWQQYGADGPYNIILLKLWGLVPQIESKADSTRHL